LCIESSQIEPIRVAGIDDKTAHVSSRRAVSAPVVGILAGIGHAFRRIRESVEDAKTHGNKQQQSDEENYF
jgi:hypothetical protein